MERLKEFARENLLKSYKNKVGDGAVIIDGLGWIIQENPALEECSMDEVRRRHQDLMISLEGHYSPGFPVQDILYTPTRILLIPFSQGRYQVIGDLKIDNPTAYIIIMDMQWWDCQDEKIVRGPLGVNDMEFDPDDQGYPLINGCRMYDVGWMKVPVRDLYPRLYNLFTSNLWDIVYQRPPKIATVP